jgi:hypothetical protein
MDTNFTTIEPGKYAADITLRSGAARRILVKKQQVGNPSARGGAYMTRWMAYNGGLYVKVYGDTRKEAFENAMADLTRRNLI